MAANLDASGTQTATINTEHSLRATNSVGVYELYVDCANMVSGDTLELRCKQKIISGATQRVSVFTRVFGNDISTDNCVVVFESLTNTNNVDSGSVEFTLKQTAGTGRSYPWAVIRHA